MRIEKEFNIKEFQSFGWDLSKPLKFSSTLDLMVFGGGVIGLILALHYFLFTDEFDSYQALRYFCIILLICGLIYIFNITSKIIYNEFRFISIVNNSINKTYKMKHDSLSSEIMKRLQLGGMGVIPLIENEKINVKYIPMSIIPFHEIFEVSETVIHLIIKQSMENDKGVSTPIIIGPINTSTYDYIIRIVEILSDIKSS